MPDKDPKLVGPYAIARAIGDGAKEAEWWVHNSTMPGQERQMCGRAVSRAKTNITREIARVLEIDPDELVSKVAQEEAQNRSGRS